MQKHRLVAHLDHPARGVGGIEAGILALDANWLTLRWRIEGARSILLPRLTGKRRADGLWQTTCFELFVRGEEGDAGAQAYTEFNFSPSQSWAAYDFTGYRAGMAERELPRDPVCSWRGGRGDLAVFDVALPRAALPALPLAYGMSAVIEELGGAKSYWALAHAPGRADFHHPACFAARLAAPEEP